MPRTEPLPPTEIEKIANSIKMQIAGRGSNISDTARKLNEVYGTTDTPQSLARQINQGTIPYWKVLRIANVLRYQISWSNKYAIDEF